MSAKCYPDWKGKGRGNVYPENSPNFFGPKTLPHFAAGFVRSLQPQRRGIIAWRMRHAGHQPSDTIAY
jgi:hypothetical protein